MGLEDQGERIVIINDYQEMRKIYIYKKGTSNRILKVVDYRHIADGYQELIILIQAIMKI